MTKDSRKPHYDIDRLKGIPFGQVVERFDDLKKKGCREITRCPWHDDKHPSLTLYTTGGENHCHCFACGNGGSTIDYVMQHERVDFQEACSMLSTMFGIGEIPRRKTFAVYRKPKTTAPREEKPAFIPLSVVEDMMSAENSLSKCLMSMFQHELVGYISELYMLGCYESAKYPDCTAFPCIDAQNRVHDIKIQHYDCDPIMPTFAHCDKDHIYWLGQKMVNDRELPAGSKLSHSCLFGEHLINEFPSMKIALVESPKNAIFGAVAYPRMLWIATGNKNNLTAEMLSPLQGRDVIVYPDHDAYDEWETKILGMQNVANFTIAENCRKESELGSTYDIADLILQWKLD